MLPTLTPVKSRTAAFGSLWYKAYLPEHDKQTQNSNDGGLLKTEGPNNTPGAGPSETPPHQQGRAPSDSAFRGPRHERYELREFIAQGAMGAVYKAWDHDLGRWVAIKCLLDVESEAARQRALREARTLASLNHPNVMRIYDILAYPDQVWIVGEWVSGQSLARLASTALPPPTVMAVMTQVFSALGASHAKGVIHRDIKPSNIMIGDDGRVALIDFGVASSGDGPGGEAFAGSLRYADPRILAGDVPDAPSDLFAAALVQLELMSGEVVLPDLAPLPLYRYMKKHLARRVAALGDGHYPPLVELVQRFAQRFGKHRSGADEPSAAQTAAAELRESLYGITRMPPEAYLAAGLCVGTVSDESSERHLLSEAKAVIENRAQSPKKKAAWIAYRETHKPAAESPSQRETKTRRMGRLIRITGAALLRSNLVHGSAALLLAALALWGWLADDVPPARPDQASSGDLENADPNGAAQGETKVPVHLVANAWAFVTIDGERRGRLPRAAPFSLEPGEHTLELESPIVKRLKKHIRVTGDETLTLKFQLEPKQTTRLIELERPGELTINGKSHGHVARKTVTLSYGTHQITVDPSGAARKTMEVAVGPETPDVIVVE